MLDAISLSLTIAVPLKKAWSRREYVLEAGSRHLIPVGINVIDGGRIDEEEVAVNINASQDLRIAERLF